jgi:hypothetical protein
LIQERRKEKEKLYAKENIKDRVWYLSEVVGGKDWMPRVQV